MVDEENRRFFRKLRRGRVTAIVIFAIPTGVVTGSVAELFGASRGQGWLAAGLGAVAGGMGAMTVTVREKT